MEWIKIKDRENPRLEVPLDRVFFAIWKGNFCIVEYDEEKSLFYISMHPATYDTRDPLPSYSENKFHYFFVPEYPKDY
jgi:hypothetical protein